MAGPLDTVGALKEMVDLYRTECAASGRTPQVVVLREAWLDETDQRAREVYGEYVLNYHRVYLTRGQVYDPRFDPWIDKVSGPDDLTLDHVLPDRVLCGSVETWRSELTRWQELLQPDEIIVRLRHFDGPAPHLVRECMERIGQEIIPQFADPAT